VRFVAHRSLRAFPGFEDFDYDFIAEPAARRARQEDARARAGDAAAPLNRAGLSRLAALRDDRPIRISE